MKEKKDALTIKLDSYTLYGTTIVILVALLTLSVFTRGFGVLPCEADYCSPCPEGETPAVTENGGAEVQAEPEVELPAVPEISLGDVQISPLGDESAPVTLIEVSDYQCPYCWRLYATSEHSLRENYIDSGKAKLYFVDFPLSYHAHAMTASIAVHCANDQGKFWEMRDLVFANQETWAGASDATATFEGYASDLELDTEQFSSCLANEEHSDEIIAGMSEASSWGVQGTPGMFIIVPKDMLSYEEVSASLENIYATYGTGGVTLYQNGDSWVVLVGGAYPYDVFDEVLSAVDY